MRAITSRIVGSCERCAAASAWWLRGAVKTVMLPIETHGSGKGQPGVNGPGVCAVNEEVITNRSQTSLSMTA
ncbi:hypothetical protein GCM10010841_10770 [Deinococcus aerophilus]|uniref:Uncharacterized protein n=1 Tax=Deinococcus aerophilus TaxID=522488 RepID=A0ABQ2GMR8_9DEIO|nr:hypothetical protein GCM10010841_10770 [Deinococcus aerophilus]